MVALCHAPPNFEIPNALVPLMPDEDDEDNNSCGSLVLDLRI